MKRKKLKVLDVPPVRIDTSVAFVDGPGRHGLEPIRLPVYPPSPNGEKMLTLRRKHGVSFGDLGRALGVQAFVISGLERGQYTTDEAGWKLIEETIERLPRMAKVDR